MHNGGKIFISNFSEGGKYVWACLSVAVARALRIAATRLWPNESPVVLAVRNEDEAEIIILTVLKILSEAHRDPLNFALREYLVSCLARGFGSPLNFVQS